MFQVVHNCFTCFNNMEYENVWSGGGLSDNLDVVFSSFPYNLENWGRCLSYIRWNDFILIQYNQEYKI